MAAKKKTSTNNRNGERVSNGRIQSTTFVSYPVGNDTWEGWTVKSSDALVKPRAKKKK